MKDEEGPKREFADIFRAASNNDVDELVQAISEGQSLDSRHMEFYGMTPIHIACVRRSNDFLNAALHYEFNPWARDLNGRLSMDHAAAQGLDNVAAKLFDKLYPIGSDGRPTMPL